MISSLGVCFIASLNLYLIWTGYKLGNIIRSDITMLKVIVTGLFCAAFTSVAYLLLSPGLAVLGMLASSFFAGIVAGKYLEAF